MTVESFLAYLTAFSAFCLTGLLIVLYDFRTHHRFDPLNPGLALLGLYVFYHFLAFCDDWQLQRAGAQQYLFLAALGLVGLTTGTFLAQAVSGLSKRLPHSAILPVRPLFFAGLILFPASLVMLAIMYTIRVGSLSILLTLDSAGRALARGGILSGFFPILSLSAGLGIVSAFRMSRSWKWAALSFYSVGFLMVFFVAASRGELLWASLIALYLYHYNIRRITTRIVVVGFGCLVLLMLCLGTVRARQADGLSGMVGILKDTFWEQFTIRRLEPYPAMLRGMNLLVDGPPGGEPLYGVSYLAAFGLLPPQALYPGERPLNLNMWYVSTYDPYTAAIGGAYNFPPIVEAYWNFGAMGCFLFYCFWGWLINAIHLRSQKTPKGSVARFVVVFTVPGYILLMQSTFASYLKSSVLMNVVGGWLLCMSVLTLFGCGLSQQWADERTNDSGNLP